MGSIEDWKSKVAAKQASIEALIPEEWKVAKPLLSQDEREITEKYTAAELLKLLANGTYTAYQVTLAFCKRSAAARQMTSCVTEVMYLDALERAKFLDDYYATHESPIGPLHGLPISVKDSFNVAGYQSTIGFVSFLDHPVAASNAPLIQILLDRGAVLHAKTNIPQTMMTADSENNIFGRTLNPMNANVTAGGSSGGEGAHVAQRASLIGVGTDIAGSIRIPSICCGTYGFKPSSDRIPYGGQASPARAGMPGIVSTAGPLATTMDDLILFTSTVVKSEPWNYDVSSHAIEWRDLPQLERPLVVGVLPEDPLYPLHPPIRRAIKEATEKLVAAGHTVIPLPYDQGSSAGRGNQLAFQFFGIDPERTALQHITRSGEPIINSIKTTKFPPGSEADFLDLPKLNVDRLEYQKEWHRLFQTNSLDVILGPGAQNTAVPHDTYGLPPYTVMWNLLDYPACIIPYGKTSKEIDLPQSVPEGALGPDFNPEIMDGLPMHVQVSAPRLRDEECLRAAKIIDSVLRV